jgi:hypothetical protein
MLSFGDNRTRELANSAPIHTAEWLDVANDRYERRAIMDQDLESYVKYWHKDVGLAPAPPFIQDFDAPNEGFIMIFSLGKWTSTLHLRTS